MPREQNDVWVKTSFPRTIPIYNIFIRYIGTGENIMVQTLYYSVPLSATIWFPFMAKNGKAVYSLLSVYIFFGSFENNPRKLEFGRLFIENGPLKMGVFDR